MDIDPSKPVPVYFQLKTLLMERISSGMYLAGDRLPTEQELCATYGISRTPVHRALSELADEGLIVRRRRHGTIVNPHWVPPRGSDVLRLLIASEEWEAHVRKAAPEDVELNVVAVGYPNLHRHITRAVAEGQAPDLMVIDSVWVREFAEAGILAPLDDLAPSWIAGEYADFFPRFEHAHRAVAVAAEANVGGVWFCLETFRRHGLEAPKTWSSLETMLLELHRAEPEKIPLTLPLGIIAAETTTYCLVGLLATNDAEVVTDGEVVLDSQRAAATLAFLKRLVDQELIPIGAVAYDWERSPEMVATGRAVMSVGGSYEAPLLAATAGVTLSELDAVFGFAPLPAGPAGSVRTVLGGMAFAIPRQSRRQVEAMRVLRALTEPDAMMHLAVRTGTVAGRRSAAAQVSKTLPVIAAAENLFESAVVRPQTIAYNRVSVQLQLMVEAVVLGRMSPEEAVERTAGHIGAITGLPVKAGRKN